MFQWFSSCFTGRRQCVVINGSPSQQQTVPYGAPQGSVIGPMGFSLYSSPIEDNIAAHGLKGRMYADDTQLYLTFDSDESDASIGRIEQCIRDIRSWMMRNELKLTGKTALTSNVKVYREFLQCQCCCWWCNCPPSSCARNLGVTIDANMTMS